ncbi:MAG TPA: ribosome maturation factor RimM [Myxococcota bacterium]|nr:ribosome maturation factor RimM [Myxococcota bacterium]
MTGLVALGRVAGAHGIRGVVRVRVLGESPANLLRAGRIWIGREAGDPELRSLQVKDAAVGRAGEVRLQFAGIEGREDAEALRGELVLAETASLEKLGPGENYWFELVGCRVELADGRQIGTVSELWQTGAHDVLVVTGEDGKRRLVPTAHEFLREVDIRQRRIVIEPIPGLLDPV